MYVTQQQETYINLASNVVDPSSLYKFLAIAFSVHPISMLLLALTAFTGSYLCYRTSYHVVSWYYQNKAH